MMKKCEFATWYKAQFKDSSNLDPIRRKIGREAEIPVVLKDGRAGDVRSIFSALNALGWEAQYDDVNTSLCVGFIDPCGNVITTDVGYCTLEVAFIPCSDLFELQGRSVNLLTTLIEIAGEQGLSLLGYGSQPLTPPDRRLWMSKGRYKYIVDRIGVAVDSTTITASDQCHVDIAFSEIVQAVNTINALSGVIIALTANSPIVAGQVSEHVASREFVYNGCSLDGRTGILPKRFATLEEWMEFLISREFLLRKSEPQSYENPRIEFATFMDRVDGWTEQDFAFHEGCLWWNGRPRACYSTIEVRPGCQQPQSDQIVISAFALGIITNLSACEKIINQYDWIKFIQLRSTASMHGFKATFNGLSIANFAQEILVCAYEGLASRGLGEEVFLDPLFERVESRTAPADRAWATFERGSIQGLLEETVFRVGNFS